MSKHFELFSLCDTVAIAMRLFGIYAGLAYKKKSGEISHKYATPTETYFFLFCAQKNKGSLTQLNRNYSLQT